MASVMVPVGRIKAGHFFAIAALVLGLGFLFCFPAPKSDIEAEIEVEGLSPLAGSTLTVSEGQGASIEWIAEEEARIKVVAPRDAIIALSVGQDTLTFTLHDLIIYTDTELTAAGGPIILRILEGKLVNWHPNLVEEAYVVLYDNRSVVTIFVIFSLSYVYLRKRPRFRQLAPFLIIFTFLAYQLIFFLDLTPNLYWLTPLSDPYVRACLIAQMVCSVLLVALWFPLRKLVALTRPDLLDLVDRIIDRYGLVILIALPLLQHMIGHGLFGYNLQSTDTRYTYMDWGRIMIDKGFLRFWSQGLLRRMETPLLATVWALAYRLVSDGYLASALVPLLFFEIAVICTFLLARELFGHRTGFYAGLLVSLSPLFSFLGYFVMNDVPSAAMAALTLCLFIFALKRDSVLLAVLSGICLFATIIMKLTGLYCAFLILVTYFFGSRRNKKVLLTALAFLILLPTAYMMPYFLRHGLTPDTLEAGGEHLTAWAKKPMFQIRDDEPDDWNDRLLGSGGVHYYMGPSNTFHYFQYLVNGIGFPIFFWGVMILILGLEARLTGLDDQTSFLHINRNKLLALLTWAFALLLFLSFWAMRSTRFSFIAFPAYGILGGYGFTLYKARTRFEYPRYSGLLLGISAIMLLTHSLAHYYSVIIIKNADYRDPIFIETSEPYYYIHRYYDGWHVGWNGAGTEHQFTGTITTDGYFDKVEPFELEAYPDVLQVSESHSMITFDTWSLQGEDGCDFVIEEGSSVSFDLQIDGTRYPERVYVYTGTIGIEKAVASSVPLTLGVD